MHAILGQKKEQTQKFRVDGKRIPVTVVEVNNNPVIAIRTMDRDGYWAAQLGFGTAKKTSKPMQGHIKGANQEKAPQFLREVRFADDSSADSLPQVGDFVSLESVLEAGDVIDVTGISKGKGFAGGVKRHHFKGGPRTHGQSDRERAPGSLGQTTTPGRVYKGKRMAGKMGFETVTVRNLTVAGIDGNVLFIEGLIPGKIGALVTVKKTSKKDKRFADLIEIAAKAEALAAKAQEEADALAAKEAEKAAKEAPKAEEPVAEPVQETATETSTHSQSSEFTPSVHSEGQAETVETKTEEVPVEEKEADVTETAEVPAETKEEPSTEDKEAK